MFASLLVCSLSLFPSAGVSHSFLFFSFLFYSFLFFSILSSARPARCARAVEPARWSGWVGVDGGCEDDGVCAVLLGCRKIDELMPMVSCGA